MAAASSKQQDHEGHCLQEVSKLSFQKETTKDGISIQKENKKALSQNLMIFLRDDCRTMIQRSTSQPLVVSLL